ncbi:MAG: ATP-binding protein [Bacteroidota bacterium]
MKIVQSFAFKVILRLVFIFLNMAVLSLIFGDVRLFFNQIILAVALIIQVIEMVRYINYTNRELAKFLLAIKYDDFSISFQKSKLGRSFRDLHESFAELVDAIQNAKIEKEAQLQYLQQAIDRVDIGIISIENDDQIVLLNNAAKKLLNLPEIHSQQRLKELSPRFMKEIMNLGDEGRKLIELNVAKESRTLSLDVKSMIMLSKKYRHITFQDIRGEIEQKEIEAWHKLIRILTHEIMNSITPVSSLTETMYAMLEKDGEQIPLSELDEETIQDLRFSLKTVQKRSDGMLSFVDDYRKLTKVGKPQIGSVKVKELLDEQVQLLKPELLKSDIELTSLCYPSNLSIDMDAHLVEQVLINIITNSKHALKDVEKGKIELKAYHDGYDIIEIKDNGIGIGSKELKEIFVPFFSTKKEGSGIGLSLSKQIMHLHSGNVKVDSKLGVGTTFKLFFRRNGQD